MKNVLKIIALIIIVNFICACEKDDDDIIKEETSGVIRDKEDAREVAIAINDILEEIRDELDYGYTYTNYSPDGTYTLTGTAYKGPIFSGAYTTEYIKKFTVSFNNYSTSDGTVIESGSIRYEFTDYSSSGYHLIIEVNSTSGIYITVQNDDYTINDIITNLLMGDTDDNRYMIWASFRSSNGNTYSTKAY